MKVLLDNRVLRRQSTGISVYVREILAHWPKNGPCLVSAFHGAEAMGRPRDAGDQCPSKIPLSALKLPKPSSSGETFKKMALYGGEAWIQARLAMGSIAGLWEPNCIAPIVNCPTVLTVHDITPLEHPEWHPKGRVERWVRQFERSARGAERIITVSDVVRNRLLAKLNLDPERISTIPLAPRKFSDSAMVSHDQVQEFVGSESWIVLVGTLEPRKNHAVILDAWANLPKETKKDVRLVFVGPKGWGGKAGGDFFGQLANHPIAQEVIYIPDVSDRWLQALVAHAAALVSPSFDEGFGLPVLEAMSLGTPVIRSKIETYSEVAGSASVAVGVEDIEGWNNAINRVLSDSTHAAHLSEMGTARAGEYSWSRTAQQTASIIQDTVGKGLQVHS